MASSAEKTILSTVSRFAQRESTPDPSQATPGPSREAAEKPPSSRNSAAASDSLRRENVSNQDGGDTGPNMDKKNGPDDAGMGMDINGSNEKPASDANGGKLPKDSDKPGENITHPDGTPHGRVLPNSKNPSKDGTNSPAKPSNPKKQASSNNEGKKTNSKKNNVWEGARHVKTQLVRNTGGHPIDDSELEELIRQAREFRQNPTAMDEFIEDILKTPSSKACTVDIPLGEAFRQVKDYQIRANLITQNPGTLWESKFKEILFHKKNPTTLSLTFYDDDLLRKTCGTSLRLGKQEFTVPEYSPHSKLYFITFNNLVDHDIQKAILKKLEELTHCVIVGFNPSTDNLLRSTQFRVLFDSETPPLALVPDDGGEPLREIEIQNQVYVFQHKIRSLNQTVPPSVQARLEKAKQKDDAKKNTDHVEENATEEKTDAPENPSTENQPPNTPKENTGTTGNSESPNADPKENQNGKENFVDLSSDVDMEQEEKSNIEEEEMVAQPKKILNPPQSPKGSSENNIILTDKPNLSQDEFKPTRAGFIQGPQYKISATSIPTQNRFAILSSDDSDVTTSGTTVPRFHLDIVPTDTPKKRPASSPKSTIPKKIPASTKPAGAKVKAQITELKKKLNESTNPLVFHDETLNQPGFIGNIYMDPKSRKIASNLIASRGIIRLMAGENPMQAIDEERFTSYYQKQHGHPPPENYSPTNLFQSLCPNDEDYHMRRSLAAIDLFLSNRAPEAYTNDEYINLCLKDKVHRWPNCNLITDASLIKLISSPAAGNLVQHHKIEEELSHIVKDLALQTIDPTKCFDSDTDALLTLLPDEKAPELDYKELGDGDNADSN
ncbi:hypothetical protein AC1031_012671 [Aphanomyces cochlioides]|nr:hypothetical protein AC1031_012671 [Aphanomyces cochlioides]